MPEDKEDEELRTALGEKQYELVQASYTALNPQQRAERARLFLVLFPTVSANGTPLITSLLVVDGTATGSRELAKILRDAAHGDVDLGGSAREWEFARAAIEQLLNYARTEIANRPVHLRRIGLEQVFGGSARQWVGVRPTDVDAVAATFIMIHAPELSGSIPSEVRGRLQVERVEPQGEAERTPERERPTTKLPRVEIIPPASPTREQLIAEAGILWTRASPQLRVYILQQQFDIPVTTAQQYAERSFERLPPFVRTSLRQNLGEAQQLERRFREEREAEATRVSPPPSPAAISEAPPPAPAIPSAPGAERSWEVKYRPCHLDDIAGNQRNLNILRGSIRTGVSPAGFVLYGPTGVGKTTTAQAFARDFLQAREVLPPISEVSCPKLSDAPAGAYAEIRADSLPSDPEEAREVLTERLTNLARMSALHGQPGTKRIALVDDINKFAPSTLDRLRPLLERYTHNVLFLFTTNKNPSELFDPAVLGRLTVLKFVPPDTASVAYRLRQIAESEHVAARLLQAGISDAARVTQQIIDTAAQGANGDVRSAIGALQAGFLADFGAART